MSWRRPALLCIAAAAAAAADAKLVTKVGAVVPNDDSDYDDDLSAPQTPHGSAVDLELKVHQKAQLNYILMLSGLFFLLLGCVMLHWYSNAAAIQKVMDWHSDPMVRRESILPKRVIALEKELEERQRLRSQSRTVRSEKHPSTKKKS